VVEQVFGGLDVLGGQQLRDLGANAAHVHDRSIEAGHRLDAKWPACEGTNAP
jgi:hypothetical protein